MTRRCRHTPTREPDERLVELVEIWHRACADFVSLARELPREQWDLPTDLDGWCVKDNVAHTAHLEAVLAGAPEETLEVAEAPHLKSLMSYYTEQGVLARRDRDLESVVAELEQAVATRYAALRAEPPSDPKAAPPKTPGDVPWDFQTLLSNRPVDVWMHEQDVRRATDRPGGFDSPVADHVLRTFGRALPMVVGKRVAPPVGTTVRLEVPEAGLRWTRPRRRRRPGGARRRRRRGDDHGRADAPRTSSCSRAAGAHRTRPSRGSRATRRSGVAWSSRWRSPREPAPRTGPRTTSPT